MSPKMIPERGPTEVARVDPAAAVREPGDSPELSVVIPAHNEAPSLPGLLEEIRSVLDGLLPYEIVVVDDASSDETPEVLERAALTSPFSRSVRHGNRCGQSAALLTGVREARARWVVTLDGDGQNDPADIPRLLRARDEAPRDPELQLVAGFRRHRTDGRTKAWASRIANGVRSGMLGDSTPDTGCGLKLFDRLAFLDLPHFEHNHRFLPALFLRNGGKVVSTEVSHRPRAGGRSHYGVFDRLRCGIVDMLGMMWLQRRAKRPTLSK